MFCQSLSSASDFKCLGMFCIFLEFITMNFCNWLVGVILGTGTDFSGIFSILALNEECY